MNHKKMCLLVVVLLTLVSCAIAPAGHWTIEQAFNEGNLDNVEEYISPDFVLHSPDMFDGLTAIEGFTEWVTTWRAMLPDMRVVLVDSAGEEAIYGEDLTVREGESSVPEQLDVYNWRLTGTHAGAYLNIQPTEQHISVEGRVFARYENDLMVEVWLMYDSAALAAALKTSVTEFSRSLPEVDLSGASLQGTEFQDANLAGANLSNADLSDARLGSANLSGANLHNTNLQRAWMLRANLSGANLNSANLNGARLASANLSDADLNNADLRSVDLSDAKLSGADLSNVDLREAYLKYADLSGADLNNADLHNANLKDASLLRTNLSNVDLRGARLQRANLRGASLDGAIFDETTRLPDGRWSPTGYTSYWTPDTDMAIFTDPQHPNFWRVLEVEQNKDNLRDADLQGANLCVASLDGANLSGANLSSANLNRASLFSANLSGADLSNTDLRSVDLSAADLSGANLNNADLRGAYLKDANLTGADLSHADLYNTYLKDTNLAGVNLSNADLSGASLQRANLPGAALDGAIFDETTRLPNGRWSSTGYTSYWTPDTDMAMFTDPEHPDFWDPCVEDVAYLPHYCGAG